MARTYPHIIGPVEGHAHQRVTSAESYLSAQARYLARARAAGVDDAHPHEATAAERAQASAPYIVYGQWKLDCACHNAPSVSVAWDLACCFECGAIYRGLVFPPERAAIEATLVTRPLAKHRNWRAPETLASLQAEDQARGKQ